MTCIPRQPGGSEGKRHFIKANEQLKGHDGIHMPPPCSPWNFSVLMSELGQRPGGRCLLGMVATASSLAKGTGPSCHLPGNGPGGGGQHTLAGPMHCREATRKQSGGGGSVSERRPGRPIRSEHWARWLWCLGTCAWVTHSTEVRGSGDSHWQDGQVLGPVLGRARAGLLG